MSFQNWCNKWCLFLMYILLKWCPVPSCTNRIFYAIVIDNFANGHKFSIQMINLFCMTFIFVQSILKKIVGSQFLIPYFLSYSLSYLDSTCRTVYILSSSVLQCLFRLVPAWSPSFCLFLNFFLQYVFWSSEVCNILYFTSGFKLLQVFIWLLLVSMVLWKIARHFLSVAKTSRTLSNVFLWNIHVVLQLVSIYIT